jgi:hypothetical protein
VSARRLAGQVKGLAAVITANGPLWRLRRGRNLLQKFGYAPTRSEIPLGSTARQGQLRECASPGKCQRKLSSHRDLYSKHQAPGRCHALRPNTATDKQNRLLEPPMFYTSQRVQWAPGPEVVRRVITRKPLQNVELGSRSPSWMITSLICMKINLSHGISLSQSFLTASPPVSLPTYSVLYVLRKCISYVISFPTTQILVYLPLL